jgi:lipopolysaccharide export system protein LptA
MKFKVASLAIILSATFHMNAAHAGDAVNVEADQMEVIDAEHRTIFKGNVVAVRPKDSIKSDVMIVTSSDVKQPDGTMKSVTDLLDATGNVVITTKTQTITGSSAKFYIQKDKLEVTGNVILVQGTSTIKGTHLNVDLKTNHLQMTGGRVQSSFVPK